MYLRKITLIAASVAALSPVLSHASAEQTALDSCSRAFAASLASPGAEPPAFKTVLRPDSDSGSVVSQFYAREYTFYLRANDRKSGLPIARATCSTDASGAVIAFVPDRPLPSLVAKD
jgi:hypothetical protein